MDDFAGRVAVVTGAASGIGRALADEFADLGMKVALADIGTDALDTACGELKARGKEVIGVPTDVRHGAQVEALRDAALAAFGTVDVVVNNAGVGASGSVWSTPEAVWRSVLDVNLWGVINGVRAFVPLLVEQGRGYVVNTASMQGISPTAGTGAYAVSKHAVVALSEVLRMDLRTAGASVGVSVLCPGPVATNIGSDEHVREWLAAHGIPPAEVAKLVVDAMRTDRFYVLTDRTRVPDVLERAKEIAE